MSLRIHDLFLVQGFHHHDDHDHHYYLHHLWSTPLKTLVKLQASNIFMMFGID